MAPLAEEARQRKLDGPDSARERMTTRGRAASLGEVGGSRRRLVEKLFGQTFY
jgi:hypothetical protein